jgi:hypothetical protein
MEACQDFFVGNFYSDVQENQTRLQRMDASPVAYVFGACVNDSDSGSTLGASCL